MDVIAYVYIGIFAALLVIVYVKAAADRRIRHKRFCEKMKRNWGKPNEREYMPEEQDKLTHYFYLREKDGFVIDDITWHDLDMDRVFQQINYTNSSVGEEYLYALLRTPVFEQDELAARDELICYFMEHDQTRLLMQEIFANMGRTGRISVIGYLTQFKGLEIRSPLRYIAHQAALLVSAAALFVLPSVAIVALIVVIGWNITMYYREKREIGSYLEAFSYISNVLDKAYLFERVKDEKLKVYTDEIIKRAGALKKFQRGRWLLRAGSDLSGGLEDVLMDYVRLLFHVDLQQFNKMLKELYTHEGELMELYERIGYLESMLAAAAYRKYLETWTKPEFTGNHKIAAEDLYHPLIEHPVVNSIETVRGVLLTGSNASGKSTFLKTMAINCLLAQTIYTACATHFELLFARIYSSMALQDNLEGAESYYIVEIKSLKRILDDPPDMPVICFVDEVLRGTNTVERIAASCEILSSLASRDIYCFAATHDIELTYLLEDSYDNYHFSERIEQGEVLFDYELQSGRAVSRNAIRLLEVMGYSPDIISRAQKRAAHFMETNEWDM